MAESTGLFNGFQELLGVLPDGRKSGPPTGQLALNKIFPTFDVTQIDNETLSRTASDLRDRVRTPDQQVFYNAILVEQERRGFSSTRAGLPLAVDRSGFSVADAIQAVARNGIPDGGLVNPPGARGGDTVFSTSAAPPENDPFFTPPLNEDSFQKSLRERRAEVLAALREEVQNISLADLIYLGLTRGALKDGKLIAPFRDDSPESIIASELFRRQTRGELDANFNRVIQGLNPLNQVVNAGLDIAGRIVGPDTFAPNVLAPIGGVGPSVIGGFVTVPPPGQQGPVNPMPQRPADDPNEPQKPGKPPGGFPDDLFRRNPPDP